jgi:hypothetical protein
MFRLIKLVAYALFGIAAYELIMGLMEGPSVARPQESPSRGGAGRRPAGGGRGGSPRVRGGGTVAVGGGDGASHRQRVGRGVVSS